jgi:hypothetical protein
MTVHTDPKRLGVHPNDPNFITPSGWVGPSAADLVVIHARRGLSAAEIEGVLLQHDMGRPYAWISKIMDRARRHGFLT